MKKFNSRGICNPEKHYMADISNKIKQLENLIETEKYLRFTRPRQTGKTTLLYRLRRSLSNKYLVIDISFEGLGCDSFEDVRKFSKLFIKLISWRLQYIDKELSKELLKLSKDIDSLSMLSKVISDFIKACNKEVILIIDEVDKVLNNELFIFFLRIQKDGQELGFKSIILTSVYQILNIELIDSNIIDIDMSLSENDIQGMLEEYKNDRSINIDTKKISERLYYYTSGYPFLVSMICQIIDEKLNAIWNEETTIKAIKIYSNQRDTLIVDLIDDIEDNKELREYVYNIVMRDKRYKLDIDNSAINLGVTLGYFKDRGIDLEMANVLFKQILHSYFLSLAQTRGSIYYFQ